MSDQDEIEYVSCAVCGRRLLPGEHAQPYLSREGAELKVCELCKDRAEAAGWLRPEQAAERRSAAGSGGGGRQRGELFSGLRERVERERVEWRRRREERAAERDARSEQAEPAEQAGRASRAEQAEVERQSEPPPKAATAGLDPASALGAFNGSEHRRTVAGLSRSLGSPRATAIAIRTEGGQPGARLTVAWDLTWYQWEVAPGEHGPRIRQISKGETIDQLRAADRNWNLQVAEDGSLSRRKVSTE